MKNKSQLYTAIAASFSMASLVSAQTTLYLNRAQAVTNNALSTASSWYTDSAGTTAFTGTVSATTNILAFNNLVTSAYSGRTGGGSGGTMSISGFQVLNPAGEITVTTANNATQTVSLNGSVGIDMASATQNFTFMAGSSSNASYGAFLRIPTAAPASTSWKINTGTTLTIGSLARNVNNVPNTSVTAQATGKTLNLNGNGVTAMGNIVFHANVGSNSMALAIDGTGTSSSGGNVTFNGVTNSLSTISITNASANFSKGGTTSGVVTVNSSGLLTGAGTFAGAVSVNGGLRPNSDPSNNTDRMSFNSTLSLAGNTTFDISGANYTGVTLSTSNSLTYGGNLNVNFIGAPVEGTYDLFNFTASNPGAFTAVAVTSIGSLTSSSGVWSGTFGGTSYTFTEATGDLVVAAAAIPESSSFAAFAGLVGVATVGLRRRRRA
jgi:fibronectin-binding autotransporter adhesin